MVRPELQDAIPECVQRVLAAQENLLHVVQTTPFPDLAAEPTTSTDVEHVRDVARAWSTAIQEAYGSLNPVSMYRNGLLNLFQLPPNHMGSLRFAANVLGSVPEELRHIPAETGRPECGRAAHMSIADDRGRAIPLQVDSWPLIRRVLATRHSASVAQAKRLASWVEERVAPFRTSPSGSIGSGTHPIASGRPQLPDVLREVPRIIKALAALTSAASPSSGKVHISTVATSQHPFASSLRFGQRELKDVAQAAADAGMPPFSLVIAGERQSLPNALAMLRYICDLVVGISIKNASDPTLDPGDEYAAAVLSTAFKNDALERLQAQALLELQFLLESPPAPAHSTTGAQQPCEGSVDTGDLVSIEQLVKETGITYSTLSSRRRRLAEGKRPEPIRKDKDGKQMYRRKDWEPIVRAIRAFKGIPDEKGQDA